MLVGHVHVCRLAVGAVAAGMPPLLLKAWGSARMWALDINFLMTVAVAGAGRAGQGLCHGSSRCGEGGPGLMSWPGLWGV